ncbi:hypothetical protein BX666DRAFT_1878828 [Dichotomocladium elegans]|nr:hypothetical protein BX666DRAFT_1878828 [Dichotomocladium elegans]
MMEKFFSKVWLSMVNKPEHRSQGETARIRELIIITRMSTFGYEKIVFTYSQQCSSYEGTKIYTAYMKAVHMRFGQQLWRVANVVLNLCQRKADRKRELIAQGLTPIKYVRTFMKPSPDMPQDSSWSLPVEVL